MKKKLNLVQTNMKSLKKKQLRNILGGVDALCGCACCGSSSTEDNGVANSKQATTSIANHPC